MADKDLDSGDGPSLEMPSLGSLFRRKKKDTPQAEPTADETPPADEVEEAPVEGVQDGTATAAAVDEPEEAAAADAEARADDPTTILDEPAVDEAGTDRAQPLFVDEVEDTAVLSDEGGLADLEDDSFDEDHEDELDDTPRERSGFTLPPVAARIAAIITGAIIGLLAVGLTYLAMRGCEAVRDTSTCGGPGLALLVAILILLVVIGSALLGAWKVTDPSSTSFLAVGLLAVVALLFLIEVIFSPWMVLVIPLVAIGTFTLSQWVTEKFIEEADV